jgi:hypothetical protein
MFTHLLPDEEPYLVHLMPYAQRHFIKRFERDYPGRRWKVTLSSIREDLSRMRGLTGTGQVDELRQGNGCWLIKYDFAVALSHQSPKASGNRCLVFLDSLTHQLWILLVYGKGDLPKNCGETDYLRKVMREEYPELSIRLDAE